MAGLSGGRMVGMLRTMRNVIDGIFLFAHVRLRPIQL